MILGGVDPQMLAAKAKDAELVQFKVRMDHLKDRLKNDPSQEEDLKKACRSFEAVFIGKLWEQMEKSIPKEGYLHSKQEDMYKSMFTRDFSEHMAEAGGIGLADMLYEQLAKRLKQTSNETLAAGVTIKPLAENGKPQMRSLQEATPTIAPLQGAEPATPAEIAPENIGPDQDMVIKGGFEVENAVENAVENVATSAVAATFQRDVFSLSQVEVEAELNRLARQLRTDAGVRAGEPGALFDVARRGAFMNDSDELDQGGRKLAQI